MMLVVLLAVVAGQYVNIVTPLYLKKMIDVLAVNTPNPEAIQVLIGILSIYAIIEASGWFVRRVQHLALIRVESRVMNNLANDAFASLITQGQDFFLSNFAGTLTRRVTRFSRAYEQVVDVIVKTFLPTLLFAGGSVVVLYSRSHMLGLVLLVWVVAFVILQVFMTKWKQSLRTARVAADSRMTGSLSDVIGNHSAVTLYSAATHEEQTFSHIVEVWRAATVRAWRSNWTIQAVQSFLCLIIEILLLGIGVYLWQLGVVTVGDFILIQSYVLGLIGQVWNIGNSMQQLYDAFADAGEMVEIMELAPTVQDAPDAAILQKETGSIVFSNVSFYYDEQRPILKDLDLSIERGQKIALVGPSGAGKTTITKLLLRLYDVTKGTILVGGQDIRTVTQDSLREAIAYVPQESILFHRTLRENILYGRRDATEEEVVEAAKGAHCHEFISALPEGYNTYVGERGVKLSGGERQRVAIARAILKNAPILVLDEATSSLDSESEALIQDALAKLMEGKTVIAIAHRLSTIMKMDRIVVMENGQAILSGTHAELLAQESNLYKKLWEIQAGGFIAEDEE